MAITTYLYTAVDNLEWVSRKQNVLHYRQSLRSKKVDENRKNKLTSKTLERVYNNKDKIISLYNEGYSIVEVGKQLGLGRDFVSDVLKIFDLL